MANNASLGPIQIADPSLVAINDAFRQLVDRIDAQAGLRGRTQIFDRVAVSAATATTDATPLGTVNTNVASAIAATFAALTTLTLRSIHIVDADGNLIHSFDTAP